MRPARSAGRPALLGAILGLCLTTLPPAGPARAASLNLPDGVYAYTVIDQDLSTALKEFGTNVNLKLVVSPEVKGHIQGRIPEGTAREFLNHLASSYNLEWYYDGSVLYITSAQENRTQLVVLGPIPYERLKAALDALGIVDARFPIRFAPGKGVAMVSGPPRYVSLVEQTLAGLVAEEQGREKVIPQVKAEPPKPPSIKTLTVFRGSEVTVIRDGRPERVIGPEPSPQRPDNAAAGSNYGRGRASEAAPAPPPR